MKCQKPKEVLTTGNVAKICGVAPRTVSKWFDSGKLKGYRVPGSKDRRIPLNELAKFMRAHNMPLNWLKSGAPRILIVSKEHDYMEIWKNILETEAHYEVKIAQTEFAAGLITSIFVPHVVIIDEDLCGLHGSEIAQQIKDHPDHEFTKIIAIVSTLTNSEKDKTLHSSVINWYDHFLPRSFHINEMIQTVERIMVDI